MSLTCAGILLNTTRHTDMKLTMMATDDSIRWAHRGMLLAGDRLCDLIIPLPHSFNYATNCNEN